jgi:hypothetical protein
MGMAEFTLALLGGVLICLIRMIGVLGNILGTLRIIAHELREPDPFGAKVVERLDKIATNTSR